MADGKHPKNSSCDAKAANRKAQAKHQAGLKKGEQSKNVQKSQSKSSTPDPKKKTSGQGKQGGTRGRPREGC